jgi:hypothetical protein
MECFIADPQTRKRKIECKPELVITSLQRFYSSHPEINKVIGYLRGDASLSLRIIDWFVTKYSRKSFIRYPLNGQDFLVYLSYKGQLKAYSKQYFDPNCRRERIMFKIPNYEQFLTTIGKLNFFRWAIETKILDYIEAHEDDIRKGYNAYLKETIQLQKKNKNDTVSSTDSAKSNISTISASSIKTASTNTTIMDDLLHKQDKTTQDKITQDKTNENRVTRRRRTKQSPSSLNKLQVYDAPIHLTFD